MLKWQIDLSISLPVNLRSTMQLLFCGLDSNRIYLRQWMPWLDQTTSVANIEQFIQKQQEGYANGTNLILGLMG